MRSEEKPETASSKDPVAVGKTKNKNKSPRLEIQN